jgi:5'-nucleotidase
MNILITNDDGIDSMGIQKLAEVLRSRGKYKVTVIAPDTNRSGISNAVSISNGPVKLCPLGEDTWSCSGYPADCVIVAFTELLPQKPELVLSGINRGVNLGTDIIYSGTAAGARQASLGGVPAISFSLENNGAFHWDMAASWAVDHLEELLTYWKKDAFVNVNIPNTLDGPKGMAKTWPAKNRYDDKITIMTAPDRSLWCFLDAWPELVESEVGSDIEVVSRNFVSVSTVYNYPVVL